jgi:deoxyribodipyrimidine photolyase-related protein
MPRIASPAQRRESPYPIRFSNDAITGEVLDLVQARFSQHYGALDDFNYPVTHADAQALWDYFLDYGLAGFGDYQDAMASDEPSSCFMHASAPRSISACWICGGCAATSSRPIGPAGLP